MVETEKTVTAIKEKNKWAKREEHILEEIDNIKAKKKKLLKRMKRLKDLINDCEYAIKEKRVDDISIPDTAGDFIR